MVGASEEFRSFAHDLEVGIFRSFAMNLANVFLRERGDVVL